VPRLPNCVLHTVLHCNHLQVAMLFYVLRVFEVSFKYPVRAKKRVLKTQFIITDEEIYTGVSNFFANTGDSHNVMTRHFFLSLKICVAKPLRIYHSAFNSIHYSKSYSIRREHEVLPDPFMEIPVIGVLEPEVLRTFDRVIKHRSISPLNGLIFVHWPCENADVRVYTGSLIRSCCCCSRKSCRVRFRQVSEIRKSSTSLLCCDLPRRCTSISKSIYEYPITLALRCRLPAMHGLYWKEKRLAFRNFAVLQDSVFLVLLLELFFRFLFHAYSVSVQVH